MPAPLLNRLEGSATHCFPQKKEAAHLRVISYNIRIDHVEDRNTHHCWSERKAMVAGLLMAYAPDIAALQEVDSHQADDLHKLLPGYALEGFPAGLGHAGEERLLFIYDPERFDLQEKAVFSLSRTPERAAKDWDARYARSLIYGKFRIKSNNALIAMFNTHFDHVGQQARVHSAKVLLQIQKALAGSLPRVVLGDFNFFPGAGGEDVYHDFLAPSSGLQDVRDSVEGSLYGPDGTWIGWEGEPSCAQQGTAGYRLDHIFVGGAIKVAQTGVLTASFSPNGQLMPDYLPVQDPMRRFPSDHLPVIADIVI